VAETPASSVIDDVSLLTASFFTALVAKGLGNRTLEGEARVKAYGVLPVFESAHERLIMIDSKVEAAYIVCTY